MDDRKSLSIASLAISDQYTTFIFWNFVPQNGRQRPFWMNENERKSLSIEFLAISDQYATLFFGNFVTKYPPAAILDDRKLLSIAFLAISDQYATFIFIKMFPKMAVAAILDDQKLLSIAFLAISDQYATLIFLNKNSHNGRRRPFWMTENHFRSHFLPFQINTPLFFQNGRLGHFGCPIFVKIDRDLSL